MNQDQVAVAQTERDGRPIGLHFHAIKLEGEVGDGAPHVLRELTENVRQGLCLVHAVADGLALDVVESVD